jgi:hypothetical protein
MIGVRHLPCEMFGLDLDGTEHSEGSPGREQGEGPRPCLEFGQGVAGVAAEPVQRGLQVTHRVEGHSQPSVGNMDLGTPE